MYMEPHIVQKLGKLLQISDLNAAASLGMRLLPQLIRKFRQRCFRGSHEIQFNLIFVKIVCINEICK